MKCKFLFLVLIFSSQLFAEKIPKLHQAILDQDISKIESILSKISDINQRDENGNTAVHLAVMRGRFDLAKTLLFNGALGSIRNNFGESPFDLALVFGYEVPKDFFRTAHEYSIGFQANDEFRSLQKTLLFQRERLLNVIGMTFDFHEDGYKYEINPKSLNKIYEYSLDKYHPVYAYKSHFKARLESFYNTREKINTLRKKLEREYLKKEEADYPKPSFISRVKRKFENKEESQVSLSESSFSSSSSIQKLSSAENDQDPIVWLHEPNQFLGARRFPLLHRFAFEGYSETLINEMASAELNVNQQDAAGNTALHIAVLRNNIQMVHTLLELGVDAQTRNYFGEAPYHLARMFGYREIEQALQHAAGISLEPVEVNSHISILRISIMERLAYLLGESTDKIWIIDGIRCPLRYLEILYGRNCRHKDMQLRKLIDELYEILKSKSKWRDKHLNVRLDERSLQILQTLFRDTEQRKEESKEENKEESKEEGKQEEKESKEESKAEVRNIPDIGSSESASLSSHVRSERNQEEQNTCNICFENTIDTVAVPCGHAFACRKCADKLKFKTCAICRAVASIISLYLMSAY